MNNFLNYIISLEFIESILVLVVIYFILSYIKKFLIKKVSYIQTDDHRNTFLGLFFNFLQYIVAIVGIFIILTINHVNVTGMFASLGIVATIVGLSLQDTFKDLFAGLNIYSNNFYKVGDYVNYNGEVCEVKFFNARITKFRSTVDDSTYTVSNSQISAIQKLKNDAAIKFLFDFDIDKKKIDKVMETIVEQIKEKYQLKTIFYYGILSIDKFGVTYLIIYAATPDQQQSINHDIYTLVYDECKKVHIAPLFYNDHDLHLR